MKIIIDGSKERKKERDRLLFLVEESEREDEYCRRASIFLSVANSADKANIFSRSRSLSIVEESLRQKSERERERKMTCREADRIVDCLSLPLPEGQAIWWESEAGFVPFIFNVTWPIDHLQGWHCQCRWRTSLVLSSDRISWGNG